MPQRPWKPSLLKLRDETDLDALSDGSWVKGDDTTWRASPWLHPDPALKDKKKGPAIRESGHDE